MSVKGFELFAEINDGNSEKRFCTKIGKCDVSGTSTVMDEHVLTLPATVRRRDLQSTDIAFAQRKSAPMIGWVTSAIEKVHVNGSENSGKLKDKVEVPAVLTILPFAVRKVKRCDLLSGENVMGSIERLDPVSTKKEMFFFETVNVAATRKSPSERHGPSTSVAKSDGATRFLIRLFDKICIHPNNVLLFSENVGDKCKCPGFCNRVIYCPTGNQCCST